MKIYTKLGDQGETSLIDGKRVPKHHPRIEAYGTIDELISFIAVIRDCNISSDDNKFLLGIQNVLMDFSASLAFEPVNKESNLPKINSEELNNLENEIDKIEGALPVLKSFIIPGGHLGASYCHVARTVCRRAERIISRLAENHYVDKIILKYVNRLSDYLFVLSRKILKNKGVEEILWKKYF